MLIKTLEVGHIGTNCYIVTDENTLDCVVIDPGAESNTILNYLESNKLSCKAIFLTHGHFDHVGALKKVREATKAPVYVCPREENADKVGKPLGFSIPEGALFYDDGDEIDISGLHFKIISTPGHTEGGVTIICEDSLFVGDTLFRGSVGRTDFPGGDFMQILKSLKKISQLGENFDVYSGHGDATTLAFERAHNPYMKRALQL